MRKRVSVILYLFTFMMGALGLSLPVFAEDDPYVLSQKLVSDRAVSRDQSGGSVSIYNDTAISGARGMDGAAFVYVQDQSTGVWTEQTILRGGGVIRSDAFGRSVSIFKDTAIIGAYLDDDQGYNAGAAYIFTRDPSTGIWTEQQKLTASDGDPSDFFGNTVSIYNDTVIIGARGYDDDQYLNRGAVYVYKRDPSTGIWTEQQILAPIGATAFGHSISMTANRIIIGAPGFSSEAYIYERDSSTGVWLEQQRLTASDGTRFRSFGTSVSISDNTAVIGAVTIFSSSNPTLNLDAAYIFTRDPSTGIWTEQQKLISSDPNEPTNHPGRGEGFGSVSISNNTLAIGAAGNDVQGRSTGAVYVYKRDPLTGIWAEQQQLTANDGEARDSFGLSVSVFDETVVIGAVGDDGQSEDIGDNRGAAYIYKPINVDGSPRADVRLDEGWYIWRDNGVWRNVFLAGPDNLRRFKASFTSTSSLTNLVTRSVETGDTLELSSPSILDIDLYVRGPWLDSFDITTANAASTCVDQDVSADTNAHIFMGPNRIKIEPPFNLPTLGRCLDLSTIEVEGRPDIDRSQDNGVYIWKVDRSDANIWRVEVVSGTFPRIVPVNLRSEKQLFTHLSIPLSIEDNDVFTVTPMMIDTILNITPPWMDGFLFAFRNQSNTCISTTGFETIFVGPEKVALGNSVNLETLEPCL